MMSINTNFSYLGMGSGLNLENIVQSMVRAESKPGQKLQAQQIAANNKLSMFQQFKSQMSALGLQATKLSASGSISIGSRIESNSGLMKLTGAMTGTTRIKVDQLAQKSAIRSSEFKADDTFGSTGTFKINGTTVTVKETQNLADVAANINGLATGVTASVEKNTTTGNQYLKLEANASGANGIQISEDTSHLARTLGLVTGGDEIYTTQQTTTTPVFAKEVKLRDFSDALSGDIKISRGLITTTVTDNKSLQDLYDSISTDVGKATILESISITTASGHTYAISKTDIKGSLEAALSSESGKTTTLDTSNLSAIKYSQTTSRQVVTGYKDLALAGVVSVGQEAKITVDGTSYSSASGIFTDAIKGVTIEALKVGENVVTSTESHANASTGIQDFITSYNAVVDFVKSNSSLDSKSYQAGEFFGDRRVSDLTESLRRTFAAGAEGSTLSALGISFDSSGKLALDQTKLDASLAADPASVEKFFSGGESGTGVADKMKSVADAATAYGTGTLSTIEDGLKAQSDSLAQDLVKFQHRMENREQALRSKFQAMDAAVTRANRQQFQLTNFISSQKSNDPTSLFGMLG
ncbi:MAG: flagellar filament capping protein FliD [Armatimonadetes bacterium]|nr:flagellar filament capping protein FliD [Armatimonadota bacterium]